MPCEDRHGGVGPVENHAVIEILVDPAGHDPLDFREIEHHALFVEAGRFEA